MRSPCTCLLEPLLPNKRGYHDEKPVHPPRSESSLYLPQLQKSLGNNGDMAQPKKIKNKYAKVFKN